MSTFSQLKNISYTFLISIMLTTAGHTNWKDEVNTFVSGKIQLLRESRPCLNRSIVPFTETVGILDFIEEGKCKYGKAEIALSPFTSELIIDICDIVNLQHPNFKKRYDIVIEQWEDGIQFPFSLFSFDKIAQAFHYRSMLFNETPGSAYRRTIEKIVDTELPILKVAFESIGDLNKAQSGHSFSDHNYTIFLKDINSILDRVGATYGKQKDREKKKIRDRISDFNIRNLRLFSSMAHDYLTLGQIENAVKVNSNIPAFTQRAHREAFLASMIQIGELATNKNLSSFMRQHMPTIPWEELAQCRNAIEHQDEHRFNIYFEHMLNEAASIVNFNDWQAELKTLADIISKTRQKIWSTGVSKTFDHWLQKELDSEPIYGASSKKSKVSSVDSTLNKKFRSSPLFRQNKELWSRLIKGDIQVTYYHLESLNNEVSTGDSRFREDYNKVKNYLWTRINNGAVHLAENEIDALIDLSEKSFDIPDIVNFCFAILNMDRSYLTAQNYKLFVGALLSWGLNGGIILPLYKRFRPELMVTRQICAALLLDNSKDLQQPERRKFAENMFVRTSTHLHDLAHGLDFMKRMIGETLTIPGRFIFHKASQQDPKVKALEQEIGHIHGTHAVADAYGYANLTPEGKKLACETLASSGIYFDLPKLNNRRVRNEYKKFGQDVMNHFYRQAHIVHLPEAIQSNPATYLASIYSLSVGIGALKQWVLREPVYPATEGNIVEKLRDGRNFIAHGDLFRTMNNIQLEDIQSNLLTDHLENCSVLQLN